MKIYWIHAQAPRRVLALVKHLGIEAELIEQDVVAGQMQRPDYTALNPNQKAPTLVDGDLVLWESTAIMAHLCIRAGSDLWPAHAPAEQVEVLRWLAWNDCHWAPAIDAHYFERIVKARFDLGEPDQEAMRGREADIAKYAAVLDGHLRGRDYVACGRLTIADFQLASMAVYWREADMPLQPYPHLVRWLDGLIRIPAWAEPWPDRPGP
ncbi:glutathione S-transferase family protein [Lysobacter sp. CA199]|uniref:glutathione S-transferase family protein n=1 Tax=Lysobacter sp. CA199 TaxID=3455608 RepID=UPI003F8D4267